MRNLCGAASRLHSAVKISSAQFFANHGSCGYCTQHADSAIQKRQVQLRGLSEDIRESLEAIQRTKVRKIGAGKTLYLADKEAAKEFAALVLADRQGNPSYVAEINSGLGYLSKELLAGGISSLNMFEVVPELFPNLISMVDTYPGRATFRPSDFQHIWSLGYNDWKDNTSKLKTYIDGVKERSWQEEPAVQVIGALADMGFIRRLISSVTYQHTLAKFGRMVLHVAMPPSVFIQLTATNEHYTLYRWFTVLFQCVFDIKVLGTLPRSAFYPHHRLKTTAKQRPFCRVDMMRDDMHIMKVVRIEPKADLFKNNFTKSDLAPFYYFLHHHLKARSNRIIPALEKWVPGCGRTLIRRDFNLFTEFGELTPVELMDLFLLFRSWPEFKHSSFESCMDSFLMRLDGNMFFETSSDNLEEIFQFSLDDGQSALD